MALTVDGQWMIKWEEEAVSKQAFTEQDRKYGAQEVQGKRYKSTQQGHPNYIGVEEVAEQFLKGNDTWVETRQQGPWGLG